MKYFPLVFLLLLLSFGSSAHQSDLSTVVISKIPEGKYVLQITSALTAFEGEVDYLYGQNAYQTPAEFNALVVRHFRRNFSLIVNESDTLRFLDPAVLLGHETKLLAEITGMPARVTSLRLRNGLFREVANNQAMLVMLADNLPTQQYVLSNDNQQQLHLQLSNGQWVSVQQQAGFLANPNNSLWLLLIIPVAYLVYRADQRKARTAGVKPTA
ncbi:hypothetical protein [Hymenobacter psychrophilus]|nr:hypothetical protein [Hymenobacter psychrophilus]